MYFEMSKVIEDSRTSGLQLFIVKILNVSFLSTVSREAVTTTQSTSKEYIGRGFWKEKKFSFEDCSTRRSFVSCVVHFPPSLPSCLCLIYIENFKCARFLCKWRQHQSKGDDPGITTNSGFYGALPYRCTRIKKALHGLMDEITFQCEKLNKKMSC